MRRLSSKATRSLCTKTDLKRSLSYPRTSGTWPDYVVKETVGDVELPASDYDLNTYLKGILQAQAVIYDVCKETQLQFAPNLSKLLGNDIFLKREDQQEVFSFKIRGAFNKIATLPEEKKAPGIVACSAGNHAQGVALSAHKLGLENLIVMPEATPKIKVDAVRKFGGNVLLGGKNYDEAQAIALEHEEKGMTLIHPFDDFKVICGQGTVGMEILKQFPASKHLSGIFSAVGGGGLISGIGAYTKQLRPETKIIAVETYDANALTRSLANGIDRVILPEVGLFADGAAVRRVGKNNFAICRRVVDETVNVTTDDICQSIKLIFNDTRCVVEPAGALGVAGLVNYIERTGIKNEAFVCITSGANMDFDRLRFVAERADRSESLIHIKMPEKRGFFYKLYKNIHPRVVTEFSYRMKDGDSADVIMSFQAKSPTDKLHVFSKLNECGFEVFDYSNNEVVKTHIRHLAAGRYDAEDERLISFEFPESPGALNTFLTRLNDNSNSNFNVSLFHYRNHGGDIGRVLAGIQVPSSAEAEFNKFLESLSFIYVDETANPAYQHFLRV